MPNIYSLKNKTIWVAGHEGLVGSAVVRLLEAQGYEVLTVARAGLDLRDQSAVQRWMGAHKPDVVVLAAAKVGGIGANMAVPAEFIYDNLMIEANVIHGAYVCEVEKLLFLGSSCIYPKDAQSPIKEDALMSGALEPSNAPYAVAKIAGIEMCKAYRAQYGCDFISAMPCNLYGPNDNFDLESGHVIPALMAKAHGAKLAGDNVLSVWGSGRPRREFLYSNDLAAALLVLLEHYSGAAPVNVGTGEDISIAALAKEIKHVTGFEGTLEFRADKPDGVFEKRLDTGIIRSLGWAPQTSLQDGLALLYQWYQARHIKIS